MERKDSVVTPERFASGRTFEQYLAFIGTPDNLARYVARRPRAHLRRWAFFSILRYEPTAAVSWRDTRCA